MHHFLKSLVSLFIAIPAGMGRTSLHVNNPDASFLDVASRRKALASATTPRVLQAIAGVKSCSAAEPPAPPPHAQDIPSRYQSGSHGELNPDEHTLSLPYYRVQDVAAWGANRYLISGDPAEANCVIKALLPWARSHALLDYTATDDMVVWFQSTWTVASLSLAVSVIRPEPALNRPERDEVIAWLRAAAHKAVSESRRPTSGTATNNHLFWRGLAAAAAGVISQDDGLFKQGIGIYATAIGEMNADGSFPAEMQRHELALHYQAFAIKPLVMIAELARRQGFDIYPLEEDHHHLADAIGFLHRAMADPSLMKKYAAEPQQLHPDLDPGSQLLAWLEFYQARTHSADWDSLLQKPLATSRLAGSATLYAAPVDEKTTPSEGP